jgi:hypothetical protein
MARMTPAEAAAVNVLVGYFVGQPSDPPREVVLALETLASRAHNRLQAGVSEESVRTEWPQALWVSFSLSRLRRWRLSAAQATPPRRQAAV